MRNVLASIRLRLELPERAMAQEQTPHDLTRAARSGHESRRRPETVTVADIRERLGQRSFGPLLLFAGLVLSTPLAGIPGLPRPWRSSSC
jgi:hypothetical protein